MLIQWAWKERVWWHKSLILALWRQRQAELCEFEANLGYREKPCVEEKRERKGERERERYRR